MPEKPGTVTQSQRAALPVSEAAHISNQIAQAESAAAAERMREGGRRGAEVTNSGGASADTPPKKPKDRAADRVAKRLGMSEATDVRANRTNVLTDHPQNPTF